MLNHKNLKLFFIAALLGTFSAANFVPKSPKMKVVVLAGTSYAGKSSVRKWLMKNSSYGFVWTGRDVGQASLSYLTHDWSKGYYKNYTRYLDVNIDESGKIIMNEPSLDARDEKGVAFNSLAIALPQAIFYIMIRQGCHNIIIDTAVGYKGEDADYLKCVNPQQFDVYVFKLRITEETAKARSGARDGAQIPYYESQVGGWDLAIDTDNMTVEEVGQTILDHIENNEPRAINEEPLRKYYNPTLLLIG